MMYGSNNYVYTCGNIAYEAYTPPLVTVSLRGNTSGSYVTTAYLNVVNSSGTLYESASSTGDVVNVQVPIGFHAYVSSKVPEYWSASNIDTNLTNFTQGSANNDTHARTGSGVITAAATFEIHNSAVGYRYFSAIAYDGASILNNDDDKYQIFGTKNPYDLRSFSGDLSMTATMFMGAFSKVVNGVTQETSLDKGISETRTIIPDVALKDFYIEIGNQSARTPPEYPGDTPFYVFRSDLSTSGRVNMDYYLAGQVFSTSISFKSSTDTAMSAVPFPVSGISASASSYTISTARSSMNYFGSVTEAFMTRDWTQYRYVEVLNIGSSYAAHITSLPVRGYLMEPNMFISGITP